MSPFEEASFMVQVLEEAVEQQGPFDGVLGFSEGGLVAQLACHLAQVT